MAESQPADGTRKWEYMEITRGTESYLVNEMNQLGAAGWEMVAVLYHKKAKSGMGASDVWTAFLKRPHTGALERETPAAKIDVAMPSAQAAADGSDIDDIFDIEDD